MSNIDVFFSRPGKISEIKDRLRMDIKHAKHRLYVAMAFISDDEIIQNIKESNVSEKKFILNSDAYKFELGSNRNVVSLGREVKPLEGRESKQKSLMHHKFWIIDDILWLGSFNSTKHAAEIHWEDMIRIKQPEITSKFVREFNQMFIIGQALSQVNEPFFEFTESNEREKNKFSTICNVCRGMEDPHPEVHETINGEIFTDIFDHYYFNIEHNVFDEDDWGVYSEINYKVDCSFEKEISSRFNVEKIGLCNLCNEVHNRKSLVSTYFQVIHRESRDHGLEDTIVSRGHEYLFCTKCIFDALTNYKIYNKGQ